jgi:hypothetical protein
MAYDPWGWVTDPKQQQGVMPVTGPLANSLQVQQMPEMQGVAQQQGIIGDATKMVEGKVLNKAVDYGTSLISPAVPAVETAVPALASAAVPAVAEAGLVSAAPLAGMLGPLAGVASAVPPAALALGIGALLKRFL